MVNISRHLAKLLWFGTLLFFFVYGNVIFILSKEQPFIWQYYLNASQTIYLILCILFTVLSIYLHKKSMISVDFYKSKFISFLIKSRKIPDSDFYKVHFVFYSIVIGLLNTALIWGVISYFKSSNLFIYILINSICFIGWVFLYPNGQKLNEFNQAFASFPNT